MKDIDVVEINEAFASMAVYCRDKLGIEWEKLNPRGKPLSFNPPTCNERSTNGAWKRWCHRSGSSFRDDRHKAGSMRVERVQTTTKRRPTRQDFDDEYVHGDWHGHGWSLCQRASIISSIFSISRGCPDVKLYRSPHVTTNHRPTARKMFPSRFSELSIPNSTTEGSTNPMHIMQLDGRFHVHRKMYPPYEDTAKYRHDTFQLRFMIPLILSAFPRLCFGFVG